MAYGKTYASQQAIGNQINGRGWTVKRIRSALTSAEIMGFSFDDIIDIIMTLSLKDFYKSMTTHAHHKIWQDVYKTSTTVGEVYLKLTVTDDVLIVSFKESYNYEMSSL